MTARPLNTSDYLLERGATEDVALVDGARQWSYGEVRSAAGRVAAALEALDLPRGSRVGLLGPNSLFWVASYLAVMRLGHVAVPLSDKLTPAEIRRNLALVDCAAALVDRRCLRRNATALEGGVAVLTDALLAADGAEHWPPPTPCEPDSDAVLMFTSGTTSQPKAVRVTHGNLQANTDSILEYLALRREDRVLVILPFFYCFGASLLHTHLRVGARLVLCHSFVFPETALDLLEREGCTVFAGVPSSFQLLLRAGTLASRELPSLRMIQQAGGKLPDVLVDQLTAATPHADLFVMYGQTEATARLSYLPPDRLAERRGSIGRGIPGVELSVLDGNGDPVPPGVRGEIYARGANISPGYYRDPQGTAAKFTPRGLRTGDLAVVDEEGFVYVVDRREDFIKSWGHRVSSHEIEECAAGMPELVSAAAVGTPDLEAGEAITLFVVPRPGHQVTGQQVTAFCARGLPRYMVPHRVLVVDSLPLNANGKVVKSRLREAAGAGAGTAVGAGTAAGAGGGGCSE